jgi:type II secretory pathway pseudopilin PulG
MKNSPLVSAAAVLFCCAIIAIVGIFGYSRYMAAQAANAAFRAQLQSAGQDQQTALGAHMPAQLPPRATSAAGNASPSPQPAQP